MMSKTIWFVIGIIGVTMALVVFFAIKGSQPSKLDSFATCLKEKQAVFYGAFWCPHCQRQKELFGTSEKFLSYVECSTPDGKAQTSFCTQKNITGYPTWEFKDGSRLSGEVSLEKLAEKTSCQLPK